MTSWIRNAAAIVGLAIAAAGGCNRGPTLYPVTGEVTLDGKPVPSAAVMLYQEKGSRPPAGTTDARGAFQLVSPEGDYTVIITACQALTPQSGMEVPSDTLPPVRWIVPEKYSRPDQSDLKVKVSRGGENHFKFEFPRK
jgi:hypothetical protein